MIEFVKENQVPFENHLPLNMGQLLSIPFILTGLALIYASRRTPPKSVSPTPIQYDNPIAKHAPEMIFSGPVRFSDRKKRCSATTAISVTRTAVAGVRGSAEDDNGP